MRQIDFLNMGHRGLLMATNPKFVQGCNRRTDNDRNIKR